MSADTIVNPTVVANETNVIAQPAAPTVAVAGAEGANPVAVAIAEHKATVEEKKIEKVLESPTASREAKIAELAKGILAEVKAEELEKKADAPALDIKSGMDNNVLASTPATLVEKSPALQANAAAVAVNAPSVA